MEIVRTPNRPSASQTTQSTSIPFITPLVSEMQPMRPERLDGVRDRERILLMCGTTHCYAFCLSHFKCLYKQFGVSAAFRRTLLFAVRTQHSIMDLDVELA